MSDQSERDSYVSKETSDAVAVLLNRTMRHRPHVGFSDEPTMCSCGDTWFDCQRRRARD